MLGLSNKLLELISKTIGTQFDDFLVNFLGILPPKENKKQTPTPPSLTSLFLEALNEKQPNKEEEQVLKTQLRVAAGYVDALKVRTQTRAIQAANAHAQEQSLKKESVRPTVLRKLVVKELESAQNHVKLIANSESNKCVNTGTALKIVKIAEEKNEENPVVFFNVVVDDVTGPEEFILHLLPDKKTPRLWYLHEIGAEYHKKGDSNPKLPGLHPNCRCKLTYLPKGFAFNEKGNIDWVKLDHDEIITQREKFPLPR